MRRRIIQLITAKELLDTLRDRRTLFVALVLPLLLYPALLLGLTQIVGATQRNLEKERQKIWLDCEEGGDELAALFRKHHLDPVRISEREILFEGKVRGALAELDGEGKDEARMRIRSALREQAYAAAVVCAEGFGRRIEKDVQAEAAVLYDPTDEPSKIARQKVTVALGEFIEAKRKDLHRRFPDDKARLKFAENPVDVTAHELATPSQKGAYSFAPMLGLLIVIMALTGAFYPAVDLAAGEKERGTMETLLVAPVTRREIVLGKFGAIWVIAVVTALMNLFVMGLTFSKLAGMIGSGQIDFSLTTEAILAVTLILIPTAALFSALALALSSFATSYKEGQHYLTPLFLVAMPLAMVALLPNVEIGYALALVPVANVVLLVKAMLLGGEVLGPALVATAATVVYAGIGIAVAVSIFRRESVLFRTGAGKGYDPDSLKAARAGLPTHSRGILLFFLVLAFMFYLASRVETAGEAVRAFLLAQAAVLVPTIVIARRDKVNLKETFSLRPFPALLVPVLVAAAFFTLVLVLGAYSHLMPEREPQGFEQIVALLASLPTWVLFVLLAILPPICEELMCRGYLLSSFRTRFGLRGAVVLSAILFGFLHLDVYRFPATFAAGLMLGYVCVRTGSIFAAVLFHMVYNGTLALLPSFMETVEVGGAALALAAAGLFASIYLLERRKRAGTDRAGAPAPAEIDKA
ncbi:MAG: ABC transporter permease subunit/CPBP intramembrane protease [Planctomycetota bacterium]|jgi:sodium transport system permease protein